MAKKSKKFQNNYLFKLKGDLLVEQMINDLYKNTIAKQVAQIENLKNQVRNLSENGKRLNDEIAVLRSQSIDCQCVERRKCMGRILGNF